MIIPLPQDVEELLAKLKAPQTFKDAFIDRP